MLTRTLLRRPLPSSLPVSPAQLSLARLRLPAAHPYAALSARYAAGQVSNKPGAEDLSHAVTNIKEELGACFLCSESFRKTDEFQDSPTKSCLPTDVNASYSWFCLPFISTWSPGGVGDAAATAIAGHGQLKEDGSLSGDYVRFDLHHLPLQEPRTDDTLLLALRNPSRLP